MNKCICTSKRHGHGEKPCGKPTKDDFCDDCSSRMVVDKVSGEEALNRQVAEATRPRRNKPHGKGDDVGTYKRRTRSKIK